MTQGVNYMQAEELRSKFLNFFKSKGHEVIKSASLVPENDPTCLFTTAGMHPLVPYLMGAKHPCGTRLTDVQKCIRTGDIDEVGDPVHLTFFEMLGNWSLGDYFKKEAISYSFEFLTSQKWLNIDLKNLAFTVFAGDEDAPFDQEAYDQWISLGVPQERIAKLPKKDNWWGPAGQTGPCGPDTEMFYWTGPQPTPLAFDPTDRRWVEIWNDVFMQYNKTLNGQFEPLAQPNVDTGMGVERVTAVLQGKSSCYDTELFIPLFAKLDTIRGIDQSSIPGSVRDRSERIVVEHIRAATFIIADGITPGKVDQAYVLRRLIRRAIREARKLGVTENFTAQISEVIINMFENIYPELQNNKNKILEEFTIEENHFALALEKGTKEFEKLMARVPDFVEKKSISGKNAFYLYETFGFPIELTVEMASENGFTVDMASFDKAFEEHQALSRKGAEQKFKGGLADNSEATAALHSATHLLHKALRTVLGDHVAQKGSNITAERLRFDFSHDDKMSEEQLKKVEKIVNEQIQKSLPITMQEMSFDEAKAQGAIGLFADRYGEIVRVYSMGDFSKEVCGGPHANNTKDLGRFTIQKEESSSRGVRRIKAVLTQ